MGQEPFTIPVDALCLGLYVHELDRPWIETPFLFQGFRIDTDDDIDALREHCRHVTVDPDRSDQRALARARQQMAGKDSRRTPAERDRGEAFGSTAFPDRTKFREMVRVAHAARLEARQAIDAAINDVKLGHAVALPDLRDTVDRMTESVVGNASAALWLTALKEVSEYTATHCINVCVMALAFGRHLELSAGELRSIGLGALLHDVGKACTPTHILEKPGPLTSAEFDIIKRHPEDGFRMVSEAGNVSQIALDIVRLHHERLDGGGYPLGVTGDKVPCHVRIVTIADVYDAMTSDRAYRSAQSPDTALKVIYEQRGLYLDEALVTQFIRCIGIFPVGSIVELDTGAIGVVVASSVNAHLQPTVLMLRTPDGEPFEKRLLVNLAGDDEALGAFGRRITRGLDPGEAGIDVAAVAREEFGMEAG